ncbi:hypothetical protein KQ41_06630 [Lysinibacillus fusiformis]|uniref:hypothetical protein n=1 Tax=Lysinibacillus fusiformis TaxID=28031 RepID=UPI00050787C3|nr:hypothetical protein [Lysinibacillus fusiformis]KGA83711.1 hypothetical protein KQ41_06630 [Lysinibacillus fusiformis]
MKILVLALIIPFLLVLIKMRQSTSFIRTWFSELYVYFTKLIRSSVIAYGAILFCFTGACILIKPLEFKLLGTIDIHLKIFVIAWTLSFIKTGFNNTTISEIE